MSMGDPETAKKFIKDAAKYAPAKHTMIDFWDHGGALDGAESDEISNDMMSVRDLANVMESAKKTNNGKNIDIVSFDACLMSTMEVGYVLSPYADYLVASEETEPGQGWCYEFLSTFSESDGVPSAVDVGKAVVDYYAYSQNYDGDWSKGTECTLALTDLSVMNELVEAFDDLAKDMLRAMEDSKDLVEMLRVAESTKAMYYGFGMIDLYDFAYKLRKIDSLADSANHVIEVLGMPPGSDEDDYNGYVGSENYVGDVLGDNPAVLYRGTGYKYSNCIGMSVFYPILSYGLTTSDAPSFLKMYEDFSVSDEYPLYIMGITALSDSMSLFSGMITDDYDEDTGVYSMSIAPAEDLDLIQYVDYITTLTQTDEDYSTKTYLLGAEVMTDGWDDNKFSKTPYETWYSVNGNPITVNMENYMNYKDLVGYDIYTYDIPAVVVEDDGEEISAELSCMYLDAPDLTAVPEEDAQFCNQMLINGITPIMDDEVAYRGINLEGDIKIKPALAIYDMENRSVTGYKVYDDVIELTKLDDGYALPFDKTALVSNGTTSYASYFEAIDIQNNLYLSNPLEYFVFQDFDEFQIGAIMPQEFTGEAIEPKVQLLYNGEETLTEGVDYSVSYSNNVEKGTANVTVTSLMDETPGELTAEFKICDKDDVAEEAMKLLPDHEIITGCINLNYEYFEHVSILETIKYYYEHGYKLSDKSIAKLNNQYDNFIAYMDLSLKNNGVELIGEFGLFGYDPYRSLIARSTAPISENAQAALKSAGTSGLIDCYYIGMYTPDEDNSLAKIDMADNSFVAVKIDLPSDVSEDSLEIYRLTDEDDTPIPVEYDIVERSGEKYAIVDTDTLGYFALIDTGAGYSDVSSDAWYAQSVKYVTEKGLMSGIGNNKFAPETPLSRNMLVTILYRMDGEPEVSEKGTFKDILPDSYYENAVAWAAENGIVSGYTADKFEPYGDITREQLAAILWRYAKYKGIDVSANENANITNFSDADKVSEYAVPAMQWACSAGIISGIGGALVPNESATRAQTAAILERMN
jgi:hypothetical protein